MLKQGNGGDVRSNVYIYVVHGQVDQVDIGKWDWPNVVVSQIAHLVHDQNCKHGHEDRDNKPVASTSKSDQYLLNSIG